MADDNTTASIVSEPVLTHLPHNSSPPEPDDKTVSVSAKAQTLTTKESSEKSVDSELSPHKRKFTPEFSSEAKDPPGTDSIDVKREPTRESVPPVPRGYLFGAVSKRQQLPSSKKPMGPSTLILPKEVDVASLPKFNTGPPLFEHLSEPPVSFDPKLDDGEENDTNVFDTPARMYVFEGKRWSSVGPVSVRLNDCSAQIPFSRIIIRLHDTHRLLINSRLSRDTVCQRSDSNQVRITVVDAQTGKPKILCIKTPVADELHTLICHRLDKLTFI